MLTSLVMLLLTMTNNMFMVAHAAETKVKVGSMICTTGYVMDSFCINRGTLFDNPTVDTLGPDGPIKHSVHCLIDVSSCVNSPFELLQGVDDDNSSFGRSWRVDNNDLLVNYAKDIGECQSKGCTGTLKTGLRATVIAEVLDLGSSATPPLIKVRTVGDATVGCSSQMIDGAGGTENVMIVEDPQPSMIIGDGGSSLNTIYIIHGGLMLLGWGFLLPSGAIIAKFFKHRPDGLWFQIHKMCQIGGLLIVLISFIIILMNSTALSDKGTSSYTHAVMGVTTMVIGLLQPLNAVFRPKHTEGNKTRNRFLWEIMHKGLGWGVLFLAIITISIGTTLLSTKNMQRNFQICYGVLVGGLIVLLMVFLLKDKQKYEKLATSDQKAAASDNGDGDNA
jgi:hypothetical protein